MVAVGGAALDGGAETIDRQIETGRIIADDRQTIGIGTVGLVVDNGERVHAACCQVDGVGLTVCVRGVESVLEPGDIAVGDIKCRGVEWTAHQEKSDNSRQTE